MLTQRKKSHEEAVGVDYLTRGGEKQMKIPQILRRDHSETAKAAKRRPPKENYQKLWESPDFLLLQRSIGIGWYFLC
jgi:hypothetical protein